MESIELEVISYYDSLFTNVHDLVSLAEPHDGRGTFTHLGVKMEGLESSRHLNFKSCPSSFSSSCPGLCFTRDTSVYNTVKLRVKNGKVAEISKVVLDTSFYTRNNVDIIHELTFINDSVSPIRKFTLYNVKLKGDSILTLHSATVGVCDIPPGTSATMIELKLGEGGLTRFKLYGRISGTVEKANDLLADNNATVVWCSDSSYGDPSLALRPAREGNIMAGWESCRHSFRHVVCFKLKKAALKVSLLEIDTYLHCLNAFKAICVLVSSVSNETPVEMLLSNLPKWKIFKEDGANTVQVEDDKLNEVLSEAEYAGYSYQLENSSEMWKQLLPFSKLERDTLHSFTLASGLNEDISDPISFICLVGVPDGGIHRFGLYGSFQ